jgi:hypothetical protein
MTKPQVILTFESVDEMRAFFDTESTPAPVAPAVEPEPTAAPATKAVELSEPAPEPTVGDTDADGMPYNAEYHANPPSTTADGKWRAKRGHADAANAARAAFLAGGGNVEPPAATEEPAGVPDLPGAAALPESAPEPITYDTLVAKIVEQMGSGKLESPTLSAMYRKHAGTTDATQVSAELQVNESARAAFYADLCDLDD